jgi:hypothetical protein
MKLRLWMLLAALCIAAPVARPAQPESGEWIDVTVSGTLKAGVIAIGGETTGVTVSANGTVWELELHGKQLEAAVDLNGARVVVTGRLTRRAGVEVRERYVVDVKSINAGIARGPKKSR